jgi:hypothetical protein
MHTRVEAARNSGTSDFFGQKYRKVALVFPWIRNQRLGSSESPSRVKKVNVVWQRMCSESKVPQEEEDL